MTLRSLLAGLAPRLGPAWYAGLRAALFSPLYAEWADELGALESSPRILDWGTGCGELPRHLLRRAPRASVEAVDESDHLLLFAEDRARAEGLPIRGVFQLLGPGRAPRPGEATCPGPYDRILCLAWRHAESASPAHLLPRLYRRLAPGGELWWADLRRDAHSALTTLADLLERSEQRPRWLPAPLWRSGWKAAVQRLPTDDEVDRAVQESAFGLPHLSTRRTLHLDGQPLPDFLRVLRLRREELISTSLASPSGARPLS